MSKCWSRIKRRFVCSASRSVSGSSWFNVIFNDRLILNVQRLRAFKENQWEFVEYEWNSPKLTVICAASRENVYGPFSFDGKTITRISYLRMFKDWLFPRLQADGYNFILQHDEAPSYWYLEVCKFFNDKLPQWRIGHCDKNDACCSCPGAGPFTGPYNLWFFFYEVTQTNLFIYLPFQKILINWKVALHTRYIFNYIFV